MSKSDAKKVAIVALLTCSIGGYAQVIKPGLYAGVGLGQSKIEPKFENYSISGEQDKTGVGGKVMLGYQFADAWAIEAQYQNLDQWRYKDSGTRIDAKVTGWGLTGVGRTLIAERTYVLGKLGAVSQTFKVDANNSQGATYSHNFSATTPLVGIGVEYQTQSAFSIRGEYEYFGVPTLTENANQKLKAHTSLLSIGMLYRY
jgi:opacity protein-like surface antigen